MWVFLKRKERSCLHLQPISTLFIQLCAQQANLYGCIFTTPGLWLLVGLSLGAGSPAGCQRWEQREVGVFISLLHPCWATVWVGLPSSQSQLLSGGSMCGFSSCCYSSLSLTLSNEGENGFPLSPAPQCHHPLVASLTPPICVCAQSCPTLCKALECSLPVSSVHGISQARIQEWVAISFSKGSSHPRDWTHVSYVGKWIF